MTNEKVFCKSCESITEIEKGSNVCDVCGTDGKLEFAEREIINRIENYEYNRNGLRSINGAFVEVLNLKFEENEVIADVKLGNDVEQSSQTFSNVSYSFEFFKNTKNYKVAVNIEPIIYDIEAKNLNEAIIKIQKQIKNGDIDLSQDINLVPVSLTAGLSNNCAPEYNRLNTILDLEIGESYFYDELNSVCNVFNYDGKTGFANSENIFIQFERDQSNPNKVVVKQRFTIHSRTS